MTTGHITCRANESGEVSLGVTDYSETVAAAGGHTGLNLTPREARTVAIRLLQSAQDAEQIAANHAVKGAVSAKLPGDLADALAKACADAVGLTDRDPGRREYWAGKADGLTEAKELEGRHRGGS